MHRGMALGGAFRHQKKTTTPRASQPKDESPADGRARGGPIDAPHRPRGEEEVVLVVAARKALLCGLRAQRPLWQGRDSLDGVRAHTVRRHDSGAQQHAPGGEVAALGPQAGLIPQQLAYELTAQLAVMLAGRGLESNKKPTFCLLRVGRADTSRPCPLPPTI